MNILLIYSIVPESVTVYYLENMSDDTVTRISKLNRIYSNTEAETIDLAEEHNWLSENLEQLWRDCKIETPWRVNWADFIVIETGFCL